jgi:chorismate mutase
MKNNGKDLKKLYSMEVTMKNHVLGTGVLTWDKCERVGDRYGVIYLNVANSFGQEIDSSEFNSTLAKELAGRQARGKFVAEVKQARNSTHIGDLFHGVFPETPEVGEAITLSEVGTFVLEKNCVDDDAVGIEPDDGRATLWMNINALYRAHEQTVELVFIEE